MSQVRYQIENLGGKYYVGSYKLLNSMQKTHFVWQVIGNSYNILITCTIKNTGICLSESKNLNEPLDDIKVLRMYVS